MNHLIKLNFLQKMVPKGVMICSSTERLPHTHELNILGRNKLVGSLLHHGVEKKEEEGWDWQLQGYFSKFLDRELSCALRHSLLFACANFSYKYPFC